MTTPPQLRREGCCGDTRKPCAYHEGYEDGWDAAMRTVRPQSGLCTVAGCGWDHICRGCGGLVPQQNFVAWKDGKQWFECPKCGADLLISTQRRVAL